MSRLYSTIGKVISGGQNGVDVAGVKTARLFGIPTGGYMPLGWTTLDGPRPDYADLYGMVEHAEPGYPPRTRANVEAADFTLRIALTFSSPGEICTAVAILRSKRPSHDIALTRHRGTLIPEKRSMMTEAILKIERVRQESLLGAIVINVAGNSQKTAPGIELAASRILWTIFAALCEPERCGNCRHPSECHDDTGCRLRDVVAEHGGRACECLEWVSQ
jgi:hypothetical protein